MVREICKDDSFLSLKSIPATKEDIDIAYDLRDTLQFNQSICLGMACNMIGINKRIIAFFDNNELIVMLNPSIIKASSQAFWTKEGCLSHSGEKEALRYDKIKINYLNLDYKPKIKAYSGLTAQVIQHELDHLEGILI